MSAGLLCRWTKSLYDDDDDDECFVLWEVIPVKSLSFVNFERLLKADKVARQIVDTHKTLVCQFLFGKQET